MTQPELPDELWAVAFATTDAGFDLAGCGTSTDIVAYPSRGEAERQIDRSKPEGREEVLLVGVNPRFRDQATSYRHMLLTLAGMVPAHVSATVRDLVAWGDAANEKSDQGEKTQP